MRYNVLFIIICLFILTGCWDIEESDRMDYIHGVGIDYNKDKDEVIVHLQIVNLGNLGTPDVAVQGQDQVTIATATGESITRAIFNIYDSTQRRLYWGHDTFALLSEDALKHNKMNEMLDLVNRYPETRYRMRVFSTKGDMKDLLKVSPLFDGSPIFTRMTDLSNAYEQNSRIKEVSVRELLILLDEPSHDGIIPTVSVEEKVWETEKEPKKMIKSIGVALATPERFHGIIQGDDINGLRWMEKDTKRSEVTIFKDDKPAAEVVMLKPEATVKIDKRGEDVTFHVTIKSKGTINEIIRDDLDQDFILKELKQNIEQEIMRTYKKSLEMDADIYRLSEHLYRRDLKTWQKLESGGRIKLNENSLRIKVDIDLIDSKINKATPMVE